MDVEFVTTDLVYAVMQIAMLIGAVGAFAWIWFEAGRRFERKKVKRGE